MQRLEDLALERAARLLTDTARPVAETDPDDVPDAFPFKNRMNLDYAHGGSSIISPLGVPRVEPAVSSQLLVADCEAWMVKAVKEIVDTGSATPGRTSPGCRWASRTAGPAHDGGRPGTEAATAAGAGRSRGAGGVLGPTALRAP